MQMLFVYNAKPGLLHGMIDSVHKLVAPSTYPCGLCALTYGFFAMKPKWKSYLLTLPVPHAFMYRDAFRRAWPTAVKWTLPMIVLERNGRLEPILEAKDFDQLRSIEDLTAALDDRLSALGIGRSQA